jgi:16S rRNA U516 pseudouridylate synthase RsuA-like enzyme
MGINLNRAASNAATSGLGEGKDKFELIITTNLLEEYGVLFKQNVERLIKEKQVVASGQLADSINPIIIQQGEITKLQIKVIDYFDYPNQGVKGVKSSKNAPNSPYKYKNYGMNDKGRASIKKYILSGKAKVKNIRTDKAAGVGLEKKGLRHKPKKSLIDNQTDQLIYMIKKYGIKSTNYFTDAFNETFKDFNQVIAEAVGRDIEISLQMLNKK